MAQEETKVEQQEEGKAVDHGHGRVADLDAAAAKLAAEAAKPKSAQQTEDEKAIEEAKLKEDESKAKDKEEEKPTEEETAEDNSWQEVWVKTGNADADAAIELMEAAGMKPVEGNEIFKDALETGDLSKVRWDLLEARLGKAQARLVRTGVEAYNETEYKEQLAIRNEAFELVGGEENWGKVQKWAEATSKKDAKFASTRKEWQKALTVGGFAARAAVKAIKEAYEADPKNSSVGNTAPVRGVASPAAKVEGAPLSRRAYFEEMQKAGGDRAPQSVRDNLRARRLAGQQAGI